jgi:ribosomal protein L11 methyltransferase
MQTAGRNSAMNDGWCALELELPGGLEEAVAGQLGEGCLGAEFRGTSAGGGLLVAYFPTRDEATVTVGRLTAMLGAEGLEAAACRVRIRHVDDERWAERYQASLRPFSLGGRFVVDPTGRARNPGDRVMISLAPGSAFGTGEHPTTRMCAEGLERYVEPDSRWVDVGCGTGILAVVARHCGAREVLAVDVDPESVRIAREVTRRNGGGDAIRVAQGTHDAAEPHAWDGVVANVGASYFLEAAPSLAGRLRPGGRLIASGFRGEQRRDVRAALARAGLTEIEEETREGWCTLVSGAANEDRGARG